MESLRVSLASNPISWVKRFGELKGLDLLLEALDFRLVNLVEGVVAFRLVILHLPHFLILSLVYNLGGAVR